MRHTDHQTSCYLPGTEVHLGCCAKRPRLLQHTRAVAESRLGHPHPGIATLGSENMFDSADDIDIGNSELDHMG